MRLISVRRWLVSAIAAGALMLALGLSAGVAGNGATVLRGQFATNAWTVIDGVLTIYNVTCNETRVQRPDGSAHETLHCSLSPGQTPPNTAVRTDPSSGPPFFLFVSDFQFFGGFAGAIAASEWHQEVTPSGRVNMIGEYPAP